MREHMASLSQLNSYWDMHWMHLRLQASDIWQSGDLYQLLMTIATQRFSKASEDEQCWGQRGLKKGAVINKAANKALGMFF